MTVKLSMTIKKGLLLILPCVFWSACAKDVGLAPLPTFLQGLAPTEPSKRTGDGRDFPSAARELNVRCKESVAFRYSDSGAATAGLRVWMQENRWKFQKGDSDIWAATNSKGQWL